jgi:hypothetical protein
MSMTGTALQAIKFSLRLNNGISERFLEEWLTGKSMDHWMGPTDTTKDTAVKLAPVISFTEFCALNPDEPERADGRKEHYGSGRQPLDDIIEAGWGPQFCASNILKYMRRLKQIEDSKIKARWYWRYLDELVYHNHGDNYPGIVKKKLETILYEAELDWLNRK